MRSTTQSSTIRMRTPSKRQHAVECGSAWFVLRSACLMHIYVAKGGL